MKTLMSSSLVSIIYIVAPSLAFLPQILKGRILYSPLLSLISIISNMIKIVCFHAHKSYDIQMLYRFVVLLPVHFYMIKNYRKSLTPLELKVFSPKLYLQYGLLMASAGIIASVMAFVLLIVKCGFAASLNSLSAVLDLVPTILQLVIYSDAKEAPVESFMIWLVGDFLNIFMLLVYYRNTPPSFIMVLFMQIALNGYALMRNRKRFGLKSSAY